jgi:heat shock protein HslJ
MKRLLALPLTALVAACMTYPPPPPITPNPPGGVYHATGHAPEWTLTIDERSIAFHRPGQAPVVQPTPPVIVGFAGEIYQTPRIGVNLPHVGCTDSVTGQRFRDRAEVTVDGTRYEGCGGEPAMAGSLAATRWRVVAVNGRPTPATGDYWLNFEASRFGAKFGCNGMGADYRQDGETIVPGPVMGTKMACPDMSFETDAGITLSQPLRMMWTGSDRLRLSSGVNRTIDLVRSK